MDDVENVLRVLRLFGPVIAIAAVIVEGGKLATAHLWVGDSRLARLGRKTLRAHPLVVGAGLAAIPGLIQGPLVSDLAVGVVIGALAGLIYDRARRFVRGRGSVPPAG